MKLERRGDAVPEQAAKESAGGKKPVLVYIMILFIAAFLLMALSFIMHQRSNQANMAELKDSVQALENAQATQGQVMDLEKQLSEAREENEKLQKDLEEAQEANAAGLVERDSLEFQATALEKLNQIQQYYDAKDYESCYPLLSDLASGLADSLPKDAPEGLLSPLEQFEALYAELIDPVTGQPKGKS